MAQDTDEVVDLEAFHQELLNSVNNVRRMVVSWLPPSVELESFKNFDDTDVNLESLRTRPERLGLGAKPSSSKTSAAALANVNSAEGRMLKTLLSGSSRKRKADNEPETPRAPTSSLKNHAQAVTNTIAKPASDTDEEEDSRAKSITAKGKKRTDLFHDKPGTSRKKMRPLLTDSSSRKNSQQKKGTAIEGPEDAKAPAADKFAEPATPNAYKEESFPAHALPARPPTSTALKLPCDLAIESEYRNGDLLQANNQGDDDAESTMTETTVTGTITEAPGAHDEQQKRKRKKKKKKNRHAQTVGEENSQDISTNTGMLFGTSILD